MTKKTVGWPKTENIVQIPSEPRLLPKSYIIARISFSEMTQGRHIKRSSNLNTIHRMTPGLRHIFVICYS